MQNTESVAGRFSNINNKWIDEEEFTDKQDQNGIPLKNKRASDRTFCNSSIFDSISYYAETDIELISLKATTCWRYCMVTLMLNL